MIKTTGFHNNQPRFHGAQLFRPPLLRLFSIFLGGLFLTLPVLQADDATWITSGPPVIAGEKSVTAFWEGGANPEGTLYRLEVSSDNFTTVQSIETTELTGTVSGLWANTTYKAQVQAFDPTPGTFTERLSVDLAAVPPLAPLIGEAFSPRVDSLVVRWYSNENAPGTSYLVEAYPTSALTQPESTVETTNTEAQIDNLFSNRRYWVTVKARHQNGSLTAALLLGDRATLPGVFNVTPSVEPTDTIWHGRNTDHQSRIITFGTNFNWAAAPGSYIRYQWLPEQPTYVWPSDAAQDQGPTVWTQATGDLTLDVEASGVYTLHLKAYNEDQASGPDNEMSVGPFQVDVDAPLPDPAEIVSVEKTVDSITWTAAVASDPGMGTVVYGWTFSGPFGASSERFQADVSSITRNLQPNHMYSMTLRALDAAVPPNESQPAVMQTATVQNSPTGLELRATGDTWIQVEVMGSFPNINLGNSGVQVRAVSSDSDNPVEVLSSISKATLLELGGLNPNHTYDVSARAVNQVGDATPWVSFLSLGAMASPPDISTDTPVGLHPARSVAFSDNGKKAADEVAYYKMIVNQLTAEPGTTAFDGAEAKPVGNWTHDFNESGVFYAHIRSYNETHHSGSNGYVRLGPWTIDNDRPQIVGVSNVTAMSTSRLKFVAGAAQDEGPAGMAENAYSFDGGETFQASNEKELDNLEPNTVYGVTVVVVDRAGNTSLPLQLSGATQQNTPTHVTVLAKSSTHVELMAEMAEGEFPNLDAGQSGLEVGQVISDTTVLWIPAVGNKATFAFLDPNTSYNFVARARNQDGVVTTNAPATTVTTLAAPPMLRLVSGIEGDWNKGPVAGQTQFKFQPLIVAGPKTYNHILYAWTTEPTHTFTGAEPQWAPLVRSEELTVTAPTSGRWHLHFRSVNSIGERTAPDPLDEFTWFGVDEDPPLPPVQGPPEPHVNSITWVASSQNSDALSGLAATPYLWQFGNSAGWDTTASSTTTSFNLTPNTLYTMKLRLVDRLGNQTDPANPAVASATTWAAPPAAMPFASETFTIYHTSAIVRWMNRNPVGTDHVVELSRDPLFSPLYETISMKIDSSEETKVIAGVSAGGPALTSNTTYYVRVRAINEPGVPTANVHLGTFTTRPDRPDVIVSVNPDNKLEPAVVEGSYPRETTFFGTPLLSGLQGGAIFGEGRVEYLRWVWDKNPTYTSWSGLENRVAALTPEISTQVTTTGKYYLHVAAYSGGKLDFNYQPEMLDVGPFHVFANTEKNPVIGVLSVSSDTIVFSQDKAIGPNFDDAGDHYGFQMDPLETKWVSADGQLVEFSTAGLKPNTSHTMNAYLRDNVSPPNVAGPVSATVVTHQAVPSGIAVTDIRESSMTLTVQGNFVGETEEGSGYLFTVNEEDFVRDSTWIKQRTWVIPPTLEPNTRYALTAKARNRQQIETAPTSPLYRTTLAKTPNQFNITAVDPLHRAAGSYYPVGTAFAFQNQAGWGKGNVEYYRVIVNENPTVENLEDFSDTSNFTAWTADKVNYSTQPTQSGAYYFHFRAYNSEHVGGPVYAFGPLIVDGVSPTPNPPQLADVEVNISSVVWTAQAAQDNPNGAGLAVSPYNFSYPNLESWQVSASSTALNLVPNSNISIELAVRDRVGNVTAVFSASTYTLAATPLPILGSLTLYVTSATFRWDQNGNSDLTRYEMAVSQSPDLGTPTVIDAGVNKFSGVATGLSINTNYWFGVRAVNVNGHVTPWAMAGTQLTPDTLLAPVIQLPVDTTPTEIRLAWEDQNSSVSGFDVSLDGVVSGASSLSAHVFTGLSPNAPHRVGVRSKLDGKLSEFRYADAVTRAASPTVESFTFFASSATAKWQAPANPANTRYELRVSTDPAFDLDTDTYTYVTSLSAFVTGLTADSAYHLGVRAFNQANVPTEWVPVGSGHTTVQTPEETVFSDITSTSLKISWSAPANPESVSYRLERSRNNFSTTESSVDLSENETVATPLLINSTYYFRLQARGAHSNSPVVNLEPVVTLAAPPEAGSLSAGLDTILVTWTANGNPAGTLYEAQFSTAPQFIDIISSSTLRMEATAEDLSRNTTYWVRLFAINHAGVRTVSPIDAGHAATLAGRPTLPSLSAKWSAALGNSIDATIGLGDLNPIDTLYALYNETGNTYFNGDGMGGTSPEPVWWTRDEWHRDINDATTGIKRAVLGGLPAWTDYKIRVIARNRTGVETEISEPGLARTVPAQPVVDSHVENNDRVVISWQPMEANLFRVYVSQTEDLNDFVPYSNFRTETSTYHFVVPDGREDVPNSTDDVRHDTEGGIPGNAGPLRFLSASTGTLTLGWTDVADPAPAPRHYYKVVGLGDFDEEGQPSEIMSEQVIPTIKHYEIVGSKLAETLHQGFVSTVPAGGSAELKDLGSNTRLSVQVRARSTDELLGPDSPVIEVWTLAHQPSIQSVTPGFDDSRFVYLSVAIDPKGNPPHTPYAIKLVNKAGTSQNLWIGPQGGTQANPYWQTKEQWDVGFTHTNLESSTNYTYTVVARNGDKNGGPWIPTAPSDPVMAQTITTSAPSELSGKGVATNAIEWSFDDNSTDESGFQIVDADSLAVRVERTPSSPVTSTGRLSVVEDRLNEAPLRIAPNSPVTRRVRARNAYGFSETSEAATAYTLAQLPEVVSTSHLVNEESNQLRFVFKNNIPAFGVGRLAYYRVKFTTEAEYDFTGEEERWDDPTAVTEFRADKLEVRTVWYLHVMSYNNQDTPSQKLRLGPYQLFQDIERPAVTAFVHEGASVMSGARPLSQMGQALDLGGNIDNGTSLEGFSETPMLDVSFAAGVPWAPPTGAVRIYFTKRMDPTTITNQSVLVRAVQNSMSQAIADPQPVPADVRYDDADRKLEIRFPLPGLEKGMLYELKLTRDAQDVAGNSFLNEFRYYFRTHLDPAKESQFAMRDETGALLMQVRLAAGALSEPVSIGVETDPMGFPFGYDPSGANLASQRQIEVSGGGQGEPFTHRYVAQFSVSGAQLDHRLKGPATLTIPYLDENNDGYIDDPSEGSAPNNRMNELAPANTRIKVDTLNLYRFDPGTQIWVKVPGATLDRQNKVMTAQIYVLGLYAIAGSQSTDVGSAHAYPVPFVASKSSDGKIWFKNLPDRGTIKIFTVNGETVKELPFDTLAGGLLYWDVTNQSGQKVAPDVYFYIIKSGGNEKKGKLVIVR